MASATRKVISALGTRLANNTSAPTANAISVAIGMPQPRAASRTLIECKIDQRRHHHAADRCNDRQCGLAHIGQLAYQHLALQLHAHDKKEQRHQSVVDPVVQAHVDTPCADADTQRSMDKC